MLHVVIVADQVEARVYPTLGMLEAFNTEPCTEYHGRGGEWYGIKGFCCFGHFFFQWLGVTRASDPIVSCGYKAFVPFNFLDVYAKQDG